MMIVGVLLGAISDGATALAGLLVHGSRGAHSVAVISFLGGLAIMAFAVLGLGRQDAGQL